MALSILCNLSNDEEFRSASTGSADNEVATLSTDATLIACLNDVMVVGYVCDKEGEGWGGRFT